MSDDIVYVPCSVLKRLVQFSIDHNESLSIEEATIDLMIDMAEGGEKPHRYYAKRWKWKGSTTYGRLPKMRRTIAEWYGVAE